ISLTISTRGYEVRVDGQELKSLRSDELGNWNKSSALLEFGNFDGYIDEVAIFCRRQNSGSAPSASTETVQEKK
ncbi:MAG TPA: hypothetical protein VK633_13465, partial [Verrucomicrobiae bacterium]|nr:hypothetical protein [Verrucomicrobiae bacterium]